jgi:hypothetical protein
MNETYKLNTEDPESIPPKELYKCVGFNNQETIKQIFEV